ncbi:DUF3429 domain-containing protein [Colwelliaceae bacterium 6471]
MNTSKFLGYAGLLPFVALLILNFFQQHDWQINLQQAFIFYSAIILSFIAGTLWQKNDHPIDVSRQILSNAISLLAFACLLMPLKNAVVLLPIGYLLLLIFESLFFDTNVDSDVYFKMRTRLTLSVIFLHGVAFAMWFG